EGRAAGARRGRRRSGGRCVRDVAPQREVAAAMDRRKKERSVTAWVSKVRAYGQLVAFSHTIFAMPFAASAVVLALAEPHAPFGPLRVLAMIACMVTARTSAMAFNRWADRDVDAKNPRTRTRHVPAGIVRPGAAIALALASGVAFCALACTLGLWPAVLAP